MDRIVFMGTPHFAVESLKALVEGGYNVVGVVTVPDKPAGRGYKLQESAVKQYAVAQNIPVLQPEKLKDPIFQEEFRALKPDLGIVVAFRMLPKSIWGFPKLGTFNLHGSLLPDYRGAAPINWAVINGEGKTGVTTFFLDEEIDTGSIILSKSIDINENDSAGKIHDELMLIGGGLVTETVDAILNKTVKTIDQSEILGGREAKNAPKIFKKDCEINWKQSASKIHDFIRGLSPYPAAYTALIDSKGKEFGLKIYSAEVSSEKVEKGKLVVINGVLLVGAEKGSLKVKELQIAGKKRMKTEDFLRGVNLETFSIKL